MGQRFDMFVLFAEMRTGSNHLEATLNRLEGVRCFGEAFNPAFIGQAGRTEMLGITMAGRAADPMALVARMQDKARLPGFRFFHDHDPRVLERVLSDPRCAKIVLTRNPLESYVSRKIASATGQWKLTDTAHRRRARIAFDADEFIEMLERQRSFQSHVLRGLQATGQTAFCIGYEDIGDIAVLNGLAAFLGVPPTLDAPDRTLKRQNPEPLAEKVLNPEEMEQALARIDPFDLGKLPTAEPRRGPGVPGYLAGRRVPLLFVPLRGGPEASVAGWLAALDGMPEGLQSGFTQKSLRDWKRNRPGHLCFAVLRHPLARAHAVFDRCILGAGYPGIRQALREAHGLALPGPAQRSGYGPAEYRADFLGFLRFVKANHAGKTGLRVDPAWATQSALLRGVADFATPDHLLREDRLEDQLATLARLVGVAPGQGAALQEPEPSLPLATIHDDELESAARAAFGRDYMAFGFGRWR